MSNLPKRINYRALKKLNPKLRLRLLHRTKLKEIEHYFKDHKEPTNEG